MTRRRFQEGCLFKRGVRRKVWVARWREVVIGEDGRLKRILRSEILGTVADLPTRGEAKNLLQRRVKELPAASPQVQSTITFADFVERWKPAMLPAYKPSTRQQLELALKNHLIPAFGDLRLRDITKAGVKTFFGSLLQRLASNTVYGIPRFFHRILATGVEWKFLQENPASRIKLPPCRRREPPFIKPEYIEKLIETLREPVRTMVLIAMMTSMRIGEILALRWKRVDLENGIIRVSESFYRGSLSSVKSQRSERQIPLSPVLLLALCERRHQFSTAEPEDLVFATRNGKPLAMETC